MILIENYRARNQRNQLDIIATVQRQVLHLPLVDETGHFTGSGIHCLPGGRCDLNCFGNLSWFETEIYGETRIRHHGDIRVLGFLKTMRLRFHAIVAGGQVGHRIEAIAVCRNRPHKIVGKISDCDGSVRNGCAGGVCHCTGNSAGNCLSVDAHHSQRHHTEH